MMAGPLKRVSLGSSTSFLLLLPRDVASLRFSSSLVLSSTTNQVTTITMGNPKKYNAWDMTLCTQLAEKFHEAAENSNTKVVVYTGAGKYHCAGGSLSEFLGRKTPRQLQRIIRQSNEKMFNVFIGFPKPIIAAVNGPGIGSGTTAPALCDVILASSTATFLTPFARLGVGPEGAASVHFERILGSESAKRLLVDCWSPNAEEAREIGLVSEVLSPERLLQRAQELGEQWIREDRPRILCGGSTVEELKAVNAKESAALAQAFVSEAFLEAQLAGLKRKGRDNTLAGRILRTMILTRPVWIKFTDS